MKRTFAAIRSVVLFCFLSVGVLQAQLINNMYFLDNLPLRHTLNPSFQPINNFYFGFPVISNIQFSFDSDIPTYKQAGFNMGHVFNIETDKTQMLSALRPFSLFNADLQFNLLDFGFRYNSNYFTFSVTEKAAFNSNLPYSIFDVMLNVMLNGFVFNDGYTANITALDFKLNAYTETALGYSRTVSEKFGFGAKLKLLYGNAYYSMLANQTNLAVGSQSLHAVADIHVVHASPFDMNDQFGLVGPAGFFNSIKPAGIGGAVDLGVNYKPLSFVTLSAAVTDLGMMKWHDVKSIAYRLNYTFTEDDGTTWLNNHPEFDEVPADSILADLKNNFSTTRSDLPAINNYLSPKINLSAEFGIFKNRLSLGLLSRTMLREQTLLHELTTALNVRPADWLNLALSYSVTNGNASNFGIGASARAGKVNIFFSADYIPFQYTSLDLQQFNPVIPAINFPLGYNSNRVNFGLGVNYVIGTRKDADRDGISDKFDKCPDTPFGVKVDRRGCPVDSDKDGVPDYLDLCPDTPKEARGFIGPDGCPLDSDGDGVPDYLDKCPDSPASARGFVDEYGCPIDTDGDGVMDYMDRCPDTPLGIAVDSVGCPIDTDGDGVPDYLDLCPNTPYAARGLVDQNGCLLDTDDDGVPDYLDLCPDTPVEARGFVDINGCLIDADDDGVPDYRDDCPDTPFAARGMVDHRGCPKDSDFDGIPDYLDDCPKVPGLPEFNGCPEIKKEVRILIQQAMQSIQFEKDTLMMVESSHEVLNQIVIVLKINQNYNLEIQGHTDNQTKKNRILKSHADTIVLSDSSLIVNDIEHVNQQAKTDTVGALDIMIKQDSLEKIKISEDYANLVKKFLISKGINEKRLFVKGFGDTKPIATNETEPGRSKNRRVELVIVF